MVEQTVQSSDPHFRQCLLEFGDAGVGHLGLVEMNCLEPGQPPQVNETCIGGLHLADSVPVFTFHNLIVLSSLPEAKCLHRG